MAVHDGQGCPQLVGCVGDEAPLAGERGAEAVEHLVEGVGKLLQLAGRAPERDALVEVRVRGPARRFGDGLEGSEGPPCDEPAKHGGDHRHARERRQRRDQQVVQGAHPLLVRPCVEQRLALLLQLGVGDGPPGVRRPEGGLAVGQELRIGGAGGLGRGEVVGYEAVRHGEQQRPARQEQARVRDGEPQAQAPLGPGH